MSELLERLGRSLASRYRIDRLLGTGGMAKVFLAQDLKHDRLVAIKVLRPEIATAVGAERFLHEIRITAALDHPHILPLLDSGDADGLLYYVMPYVEGDTVRERLERERRRVRGTGVVVTVAHPPRAPGRPHGLTSGLR